MDIEERPESQERARFDPTPHVVIRQCRILAGDGSWTVHETLLCPKRWHAVEIDECFGCDDCHGGVPDSHGRTVAIKCGAFAEAAPTAFRSVHPGEAPLWRIMSSEVVCVRTDVSGEMLMEILLDGGFGGAPVVDEAGRLVGVVTKTDLVRDWYANGGTETLEPAEMSFPEIASGVHAVRLPRTTVTEIMTPALFALPEAATVGRAAALMAYEGVHRLPIVAPDGGVVGILTTADIARYLAVNDGYVVPSSGMGTRLRSWTLSAEPNGVAGMGH